MKLRQSFINTIVISLTSATFWIAISAIGTLITLQFIRLDASHTADINAFKFLKEEDDRFRSSEIERSRSHLAKILLNKGDHYVEIDSILGNHIYALYFFDDLGLLMRKKIVPPDMMWTVFSYDILGYWNASKGYIDSTRIHLDDNSVYSDFEYLYNTMYRLGKQRHKSVDYTEEDVRDYLIGELLPQDRDEYLTQGDTLKTKIKH